MSGKEGYRVSVVICTYNRAGLLQGALDSLEEQFMPRNAYQIVVVDDGSTDETEDVMRTRVKGMGELLEYYRIEHAGRSAARNRGIKEAVGDYILFVDDDILAPRDLLQEHHEYHKSHRHIVVRGPIINVKEYCIPDGMQTSWRDYSSAFFCTCNASISKFALLQVGGFDESFTEYGFEDNELGWRLREAGWTAQFNMRAVVYHYKPTLLREQMSEMIQKAQELGRSAVAYYGKHPHWKVALATGLHPWLKPWNRLQASEWLHRTCVKLWEDQGDDMRPGLRALVERRIFQYHYLRSLEEELNRVGPLPEGGSSSPVNSHLGGGNGEIF